METQKFQNTKILITGASMGIGRELALAFAEEGAQCILVARSADKLEQVAKEIKAVRAPEALVLEADVCRAEDQKKILEAVSKKFEHLDILIHNAGKGVYSFIEHLPVEEARTLMELNFFAPLILTQLFLPLLKKSQSSKKQIIHISSIAGRLSIPKMGIYSASKFALNALGDALRIELKKEKIHVLSVYPGVTDTPFSTHASSIDGRPESFATPGQGMSAALVAKKILNAACRKKRDEFISFQNRLLASIHHHFPKFTDWMLRKFVQ
ncbi:MAG: SDR family NAD(P)-dependent oxidoreductase [Deltaproteobacteria bacterium]|nr:SDR family NAD(P)-dependent oxidoreductase [Deltaproteobacteria bacterium]